MFACNAWFSMHRGRQCATPDALPDAGPGRAPKGASPNLGGGAESFSLSSCAGKTLKSVNVCLQRPVFNASGPAVCRPQWLAGRWVGRRAEWRVAWPWQSGRIPFFLSYCVGKTLKSVNVCLQCPVFNALGVAVCCPRCLVGRWAGRRAESFFLCRLVLAKR